MHLRKTLVMSLLPIKYMSKSVSVALTSWQRQHVHLEQHAYIFLPWLIVLSLRVLEVDVLGGFGVNHLIIKDSNLRITQKLHNISSILLTFCEWFLVQKSSVGPLDAMMKGTATAVSLDDSLYLSYLCMKLLRMCLSLCLVVLNNLMQAWNQSKCKWKKNCYT